VKNGVVDAIERSIEGGHPLDILFIRYISVDRVEMLGDG
jgi:hypothetical protein